MSEVNEARKIVAHASSGVSISVDQLTALEQYAGWLDDRIAGRQELDGDAWLNIRLGDLLQHLELERTNCIV